MTFALTKNNKKVLETYRKLWNEIKIQIETTDGGESIKYKKDFIEIRFDSNNDLTIDKILSIPILSIVFKFVFQNENKYYPQIQIYECEYDVSLNYKNMHSSFVLYSTFNFCPSEWVIFFYL